MFELVVLGVVAWLIGRAPFIDDEYKVFIKWALIVIGAIIIVLFVWGLLGGGGNFPSLR